MRGTSPPGTASIIVAAALLASVAARLLFSEAMTAATVLGSVIAFSGVAIVRLTRAQVSASAAVGTAVAAMIVRGIYHPLQRPLLRRYTGPEVATYAMVAGTLMILPFLPFGWDQLTTALRSAWVAALYLGRLPLVLGFVLWAEAVARLPVAVCTSLRYGITHVDVGLFRGAKPSEGHKGCSALTRGPWCLF